MSRIALALLALTCLAVGGIAHAKPMDAAALHKVVAKCAPQVAPATMLALIAHESGGDPYAIGINSQNASAVYPPNASEATAAAKRLLKADRSADFGLGQINSANLKRLGLTAETVFDPCKNVAAAAELLTEAYVKWRPQVQSDQAALNRALSTYNTGSPVDGQVNGYVAAVRHQYTVPTIEPAASRPVVLHATRRNAPKWDVYGHAMQQSQTQPAPASSASAKPVMVFQTQGPGQ